MPRRFWTQARIAELMELWRAGKNAGAIGAALEISRSAVLGKVFRLRLVAQGRRRSAPAPNDTPARRRAAKTPPPQPARAKSRRKTLLELSNECCRWPYGELGERRFLFCSEAGADVARGIPYCPRHMARAYIVPPSLVKPLHKMLARASWKGSAAVESNRSSAQTQRSPDEAKRNPGQPSSLRFCSRTSLRSVRATESRKRQFG